MICMELAHAKFSIRSFILLRHVRVVSRRVHHNKRRKESWQLAILPLCAKKLWQRNSLQEFFMQPSEVSDRASMETMSVIETNNEQTRVRRIELCSLNSMALWQGNVGTFLSTMPRSKGASPAWVEMMCRGVRAEEPTSETQTSEANQATSKHRQVKDNVNAEVTIGVRQRCEVMQVKLGKT